MCKRGPPCSLRKHPRLSELVRSARGTSTWRKNSNMRPQLPAPQSCGILSRRSLENKNTTNSLQDTVIDIIKYNSARLRHLRRRGCIAHMLPHFDQAGLQKESHEFGPTLPTGGANSPAPILLLARLT
ncbi:unnamed protein product [Polarella glacialis]|uniref:Uncharacterized protein n=1 Tax=Polarella glacialis TaxID=89957 RepID=A0A813F4L0_POLGL|nr:unnamed protein product [Polarella glacialis]